VDVNVHVNGDVDVQESLLAGNRFDAAPVLFLRS
jgi:hypothetical protein